MLNIFWATLFFLFSGLSGLAQEAALLDAHAAFEKGDFAQSAKLYSELAQQQPDNAALHHNLGLALAKNQQLGAAVAAYLRAVQLEPNNPDFRYNLEFLLKETPDRMGYEETSFSLKNLSQGIGERWLFYPSLILALLSFAFAFWNNQRKARSAALWSLSSLLLLASAGGAILLVAKVMSPRALAAVATAKAELHPTPGQGPVILELQEGSPVEILETKEGWMRVRLVDQRAGWIRQEALAAFGQRYQFLPKKADGEGS